MATEQQSMTNTAEKTAVTEDPYDRRLNITLKVNGRDCAVC